MMSRLVGAAAARGSATLTSPSLSRRMFLVLRDSCLSLCFWRVLMPRMRLARIDQSSFSSNLRFCRALSLSSALRLRCGYSHMA